MILESNADRLAMLTALGETVKVDSADLSAIFEHQYVEIQGIESQRPTLLVRSSDVSGIGHGTVAVVAGASYQVKNIQDQGDGMTLLVLEKQ